jgi:ribosomal 50S subunit-recycling heat shock protein
MPTVLSEDGFRLIIYFNDHLPAHIHAIKGGGEVRIELGNDENPPSILDISGDISNKEVAKALYIVKENQLELLAKWREIHG